MSSLYISIILLMRVLQSTCSKKASSLLPESPGGKTKYFAYNSLFAAMFAFLVLLAEWDFSSFDIPTLCLAALSGLSLAASTIFSMLAIQGGTIVLSSMFGTAGILVPCIAGIFWFAQPMSWPQWLGIALLFVAAYLLIASSKQIYNGFSLKTLLLLTGTLAANGLTMLFQLFFSRQVPNGSVSLFSFLTFLIPSVVLFCAVPFLSKGRGAIDHMPKQLIILSLLLAFAVFIINQLATLTSATVPPAILFAFINGGATIIAALVGAALFHEKLTVRSVCGILLGVAALIMIKAFE